MLIIWSQFRNFKYLCNLQTAHHWSQNSHQRWRTDVIGDVGLYIVKCGTLLEKGNVCQRRVIILLRMLDNPGEYSSTH